LVEIPSSSFNDSKDATFQQYVQHDGLASLAEQVQQMAPVGSCHGPEAVVRIVASDAGNAWCQTGILTYVGDSGSSRETLAQKMLWGGS
jgi:hypothetical protein